MSLFGLVEEIQKQKQFLSMEHNEFTVSNITLQGLEIINAIAVEYLAHPKAIGKHIEVDKESINVPVYTDFALIRRVVLNMVVNALEAMPNSGTVTLGLRKESGKAVFWVKNCTVMPESVKGVSMMTSLVRQVRIELGMPMSQPCA